VGSGGGAGNGSRQTLRRRLENKGDDMLYQPSPARAPSPAPANAGEKMTPTRKRVRELAERTSNGTRMRPLWLHGTRELWVEIYEPEFDVTIVIRPSQSARWTPSTIPMRTRRPTGSRLPKT
jgi:hypothetical protein